MTAVGAHVELRAELQRRLQAANIDANAEPDRVRSLIRQVVDHYQAKARGGIGRPLADPDLTIWRLERSTLGQGPLEPLLQPGAGIEEIFVKGDDLTYLDRCGRLCSLDEPTDEEELRSVVTRLLMATGRSVDTAHPIVDAQVLDGRGRLTVLLNPVTKQFSATLRLYTQAHETLDSLVANDTLSAPAANLLAATMRAGGLGVLLGGPPGSGKTTLANAMLRAVPQTRRVITTEETFELSVPLNNGLELQTRPAAGAGVDQGSAITLRDLVKTSLRLRPDLLVVGEVRSAEAFELTRAANAGAAVLTTIHANSCRDALQALCATALMAGENVPVGVLRAIFSRTFHLLVHLDKDLDVDPAAEGPLRHQVMEISAMPALQGGEHDFTVEPIFVREEIGAPLLWTGASLPDALGSRLARVLRRNGATVHGLLDGGAVAEAVG